MVDRSGILGGHVWMTETGSGAGTPNRGEADAAHKTLTSRATDSRPWSA